MIAFSLCFRKQEPIGRFGQKNIFVVIALLCINFVLFFFKQAALLLGFTAVIFLANIVVSLPAFADVSLQVGDNPPLSPPEVGDPQRPVFDTNERGDRLIRTLTPPRLNNSDEEGIYFIYPQVYPQSPSWGVRPPHGGIRPPHGGIRPPLLDDRRFIMKDRNPGKPSDFSKVFLRSKSCD